jgi:D-glycero-D-manno-heptose 1,7-bisphosphate phosphatase
MQYTSLTAHLFDLDGTLIRSYMDRPDKDFHAVELLPGVAEKWATLREQTGNNLAIITNQAGVAFGYVSEGDVQRKLCAVGAALGYGWIELHDGSDEPQTLDTNARHASGVLRIYVCYGDIRSKDARYQDASRRKPSGTMIREAARIEGYTNYILMVGDRPEDEQAARAAGVAFAWAKDFFAQQEEASNA